MPGVAPLQRGDPERVGPYRLVGRLGEGGQGTVFLAEGGSGERVAVKMLHARLSGDARARSRFAAEVKVAQRVAPFCTARVLDADVEGETPYIVSEYIDGPSLQAVSAAEGPLSGPALTRVAIGTVTALAAIHEAGVVHRDFKPGNVLLASDGPRLIDFGIARALDATGTLSSTAVGTPAYMAPEQIHGHRVGPATDMFAWGATMVHAATGRPAFGQDSIPAVMHRILNQPPDLGALTGPLRDTVALCLAKDPAQRPSSHTVLLRLLHEVGAVPRVAEPVGALHQGAEVAAASSPPTLGEIPPPPTRPPGAPWAAAPPPGPAPHVMPDVHRQAPVPGGGRSLRDIGVLAGGAVAAVVALVLLGTYVIIELGDGAGTAGGTTGGGRPRGQLTMSMPAPEAIDPSSGQWSADRTFVKQLFTGLVDLTPEGVWRPRLASSIVHDEQCRGWTIRVRGGTTFSDGEPVGAEAVLRGWDRAAQGDSYAAPVLMGDIEGYDRATGPGGSFSGPVRVEGDTLRLTLTEPDCRFAARLADPIFFPVPAGAGAHDDAGYDARPIGNGPFKIESYRRGRQAVLVRNDAWGFGRARLDRVVLRFAADPAAGIAGARAGDVDWTEPSTAFFAQVRGLTDHTLLHRPSDGAQFLVPITARGPMRRREVREAVALALDRRRIGDLHAGGLMPPATGLVPTGTPGFSQGACTPCASPDPERAKTLMAGSGLDQGTEIPILVREGGSSLRWAEIAADQLRRTLGWRFRVVQVTAAEFNDRIADDSASGLIAMGWLPDYPSAHAFLHPLLGGDQKPPEGGNHARWRNDRFDELLRKARGTPDDATAHTALREAERIALNDWALIPVLNLSHVRLAAERFTGLHADFHGDPTLATTAPR
ncbi:ABC transporter substrate-binding protein [Thermomonospora umbrina]|uniref:ABC-type transport system substrate-binding protein n=1 Tax=Thermomonospora umbrina TaxID=111806 RepID=A0A3D9SHF1_9ACTN|nr:ABC transporter substrate-binding protein [Thermomonospora umbrina]REE95336.1 ABC-type transport system substrate-binding protein [Thermomonospora umbrina]